MIYFFADGHYDAHPGREIFRHLSEAWRKKIDFSENDWAKLEAGLWEKDAELLILNLIAGTCGQPQPGEGAEKAMKKYVQSGRPLLLLHGASAAFWPWAWWRVLPGLRWVRPVDEPDGVEASRHPHAPCRIEPVLRSRHPLAGKLRPIELPEDEIYIDLEETAPYWTLMKTHLAEGTYPQMIETKSPRGGRIISFLPGHRPECTGNPDLVYDVELAIEDLLAHP
ncbi:MAG: ThuA domain-containing protein [Victivallaceae bacterium]|nr:ThuA domain-containing protein [Victivallaceae bacterium]